MKRMAICLLAIMLLTTPSICDDAKKKDKAWLDLHNCSFCKMMGDNMDMMEHVKWENHKIANGSLSASVIPEEYQQRMDTLHNKMRAVAAKLEQGEQLPLCGFCTSYGELKAAGAKTEEIKTDFGMIELMTSDDPAVVKRIHEHTDRTNAEFKKFLEAEGKPK